MLCTLPDPTLGHGTALQAERRREAHQPNTQALFMAGPVGHPASTCNSTEPLLQRSPNGCNPCRGKPHSINANRLWLLL